MKRIVCVVLMLGLFCVGMVGCAKNESTNKETQVKTPGGTTTITTEKDAKKTGDTSPSAHP